MQPDLKSGKSGKEGAAGKCGAASEKAVVIKPLKISIQHPRQFRNCPLNITKTFTLSIYDQRKKKIFETQQDIKLPENTKPPLIFAMQPIIISEYN